MKKYFFLFLLVTLLTSCSGIGLFHKKVKESSQISSELVPPVIKETFLQKYPQISADKWYKVNENVYAVRFEINNKKKYKFFSKAGILIDDENYDLYDYNYPDDDFMENWDYFNIIEY